MSKERQEERQSVVVVQDDITIDSKIDRAFTAIGGNVQTISYQEASGGQEPRDAKIVIADFTRKKVLNDASQHYPETFAIALSKESNKQAVSFLNENENVYNLIAVEKSSREIEQKEAMIFGNYILYGREPDIQNWLPWGTNVFKTTITSAHGRFVETERALEFVSKISGNERIGRGIADVIEELLANAIFHAPVNESGLAKYAECPRDTDFALSSREKVTLEYGSDSEHFVVSVSDNFGRLQKEKVLQYLERCFTREEGQVLFEGIGAGIGLFMALHFTKSLCFNVVPGVTTKIIAVFNIAEGYKGFRKRHSSIHFIKGSTKQEVTKY